VGPVPPAAMCEYMPKGPQGAPVQDELDAQIEYVLKEGVLTEAQCEALCERAHRLLQDEPNCVQARSPITIVGDVHGQFEDVKEMLNICGPPPDTNYLFLGDYVDRGLCSVRTVTLVFLLKVRHPQRVVLLRGNHETRQITQVYGFYEESVRLYGNARVWQAFVDVFDYLPLTAVVENRIFCTHAGLSPSLSTLDDIGHLDRIQEVPHNGPICDLLWSDPTDTPGWSFSARGAGFQFGQDVSEQFNHVNGLTLIARGHQVVPDGYQWAHGRCLVTVFSAPNYCYMQGNRAAVMDVDENLECGFRQFDESPFRDKEPTSGRSAAPDYFGDYVLWPPSLDASWLPKSSRL